MKTFKEMLQIGIAAVVIGCFVVTNAHAGMWITQCNSSGTYCWSMYIP